MVEIIMIINTKIYLEVLYGIIFKVQVDVPTTFVRGHLEFAI